MKCGVHTTARAWQCGARATRRAGLVALAMLPAACSNPVSPGDHVSPDGFVIVHADQELVRQEGGTVTGTLQLVVGQQLGPVTVHFQQDGAVIAAGADFFLEIEIADAGTAAFTHSAPGSYTGTFSGVAEGATTMRVRLMHGRIDNPFAHPDFESRAVPVSVAGD